ncbi:MAG: hypothetical protein MIN69_23190 [Methylorubrum extorquens]|jgi:hypothetical protein|uniref:Uncharacterized protein n=1 Tax=Methylorubrum extorquens (strain DSM 6343 / CIP 106787 / DM4) TaxID=661410 RepID=C7CLP8_METED|nr:hypothetical protein [Methylorubrum extorquens]CAX26897.1 protein of unknown function; putative membrane protein precursor [Methylorubrum extorquens DM4]
MRIALTLAAGALLGSLGLGVVSASAAPALPAPGLIAGRTAETVRDQHHDHWHRPHHSVLGHHHSTKAERHRRRLNTHHHGDPNARNPERPGYQQQLGTTTGGPRY